MADLNCKLLVIVGRSGRPCLRHSRCAARRRYHPGGIWGVGWDCLNVGCIPSKALIHSANESHKLRLLATQSLHEHLCIVTSHRSGEDARLDRSRR